MIWIKKLRKRIGDQSCKLRFAGRRNAGTTMVELIVSFALLAIFLTAVTMVISNALLTYYREQKQMSIYSVADTVLSEIREDVRTMQPSVYPAGGGSGAAASGYIKLRNDGVTAPWNPSVGEITGETIEFVKSKMQDGVILEQIDAKGCADNAVMVELREDETTHENKVFAIKEGMGTIMPAGRIIARYYLKAPEQTDSLRNYFMDIKHPDSVVAKDSTYTGIPDNTQVVWDAEDRLPAKLYQGLTVKTSFTIKPEGADLVVPSVEVKVSLYDPKDPDTPVYEKKGTIPLQNTVRYNLEKTVYSKP